MLDNYGEFFNKKPTITDAKNLVYRDECDFYRKVRSLRTYCPRSYKNYLFKISKEGYFETEDGRYSKDIYTSKEFRFIYGQIKLIYSIEKNKVIIEDIEPAQFLIDGYKTKLETYRSMFYRDERDKFKIDLMFLLKEGW